jgi:hypothetical protein
LQTPIFLSEFGTTLRKAGAKDTARMISAVYQAMEISDGAQPVKTRYADFYSPLVSGTERHWDYYYNKHREPKNGKTSKLLTSEDAWNGENFSVVSDYGTSFNMDLHAIQRAYPRRAQGHIMSFHYNTVGCDDWNKMFKWAALRPSESGATYFMDRRFALLIWRGRRADAPTEVFLPPHLDAHETALITEKTTYNKGIPSTIQSRLNEAVIIPDINREGVRLFSGQVVPVIDLDATRGLYGWNVNELKDSAVAAVRKSLPETPETKAQVARKALESFLHQVYYKLRNLGMSSEERALNFAATNAFQVASVFGEAVAAGMVLDSIQVARSPFCRMDSDCWDVTLAFFDPENTLGARKVWQFTIDVSDVIPVSVSVIRAWSSR